MTKEENLALRDRLKELGLDVDTYTGNGSLWVASMKDPFKFWNSITIVDCTYGGEDIMKYRIKFDDSVINKSEFFIEKRISECSVIEVMESVNKIDLMYKEWLMEKKIERIKDDF